MMTAKKAMKDEASQGGARVAPEWAREMSRTPGDYETEYVQGRPERVCRGPDVDDFAERMGLSFVGALEDMPRDIGVGCAPVPGGDAEGPVRHRRRSGHSRSLAASSDEGKSTTGTAGEAVEGPDAHHA